MKPALKAIATHAKPIILLVCGLFFDKKYLTGRYFDTGFSGLLWAMRSIWTQHILRLGPVKPWPTALSCHVSNPDNIVFHPDDLNNFQSPGTYFQNFSACIYLGRGVYIGPNVGIITANHRLDDLDSHYEGKDVTIGERSWIGMNSVILPGVVLGDETIVAAGSVVTKSFADGHVVVGGVPANVLKRLD